MSPCLNALHQAVDGAGAGTETVGFNADSLQHADKQLAERRILLAIAGDMPPVAITAAGQQNRQVVRTMAAGVPRLLPISTWV